MRLLLHVCFINSCACFNGPLQGLSYPLNDGTNNIMEINGKIFEKFIVHLTKRMVYDRYNRAECNRADEVNFCVLH